jgi:hypothetical protein
MKVKIGDKLVLPNGYDGYEVRTISSIGKHSVMTYTIYEDILTRTSLTNARLVTPEFADELNSIETILELASQLRNRKYALIKSLPQATLEESGEVNHTDTEVK